MSKPKILVLDIETAPATAFVWRLFDENIGLDQLITPSKIISVGMKFVGEAKMYYRDSYQGEKAMLELAAKLLTQADAVVTYNGDKFDLPKLMGAFILHGIKVPPPLTSIDVLKTVRKLGLQSGRLAFAVPYFGLGAKGKTDFRLWRKFLEKDPVARAQMKRYNLQDVRILERLYKKLLPAMKTHPKLFRAETECGRCGAKGSQQKRGFHYTPSGRKYQRLHCTGPKGCGSWSRVTKAEKVG